ncbi:hypothetical protein JXA88_01035 [Candidatus Fermentibacteria bacterium]|nr:hypothetical protein [Candidatus Fermentibacteria bacterium]
MTTDWADAGTADAAVSQVVGGLSNGTMYAWRAWVGYRMSDCAPQPPGRWIYQPYKGGLGEADFQVGGYDPPGAPTLHITTLSPRGDGLLTVPGNTRG